MSKWEDKYEEYKNGGIDTVISKLTSKGISTKEDKKEYKRLSKIKDSMPQVENIMEYRNKLKEELKLLKSELETRKSLEQAADKKKKLEEKISKYQSRYEEIEKELKNKDLTDSERAKLESEKTEISTEMPKAQDERDKEEQTLFKGLEEKREWSRTPKEEINNKILETQTKISKCNLVARNLLQGLSWEQIDIKLDNWKDRNLKGKKTSNPNIVERYGFKLDTSKIEEPEKEPEKGLYLNEDELREDFKKASEYNKTQTNYPEVTFETRHPILSKMGKFFKKGFENIKSIFSEKTNKPDDKFIKEDVINTIEDIDNAEKEDKSFKEYIREIAEKGMDGISEEEKAAKQEELKKKLEELRSKNRENEAKKFGKDYAEQSDYRKKEDDGSR